MTSTVRPPAVAGMFYPNDTHELRRIVHQFLKEISALDPVPVPKAIIVPHAGYIYSGPIAASAYARLTQARDIINKVVLFGPCHRVPLRGIAATSMNYFATPLGTVPVDQAAIKTILSLPQVVIMDQAHAYEHSLEVQLPFLQEILADFSIIPFVVGEATPQEVSAVLEKLWGGEETLIVISSDLSHYRDYHSAQQIDKLTSQAIEDLRPEAIHHEQACGQRPINGLLSIAKNLGMRAQTIDLRNSGDTAGPKHQVVGYGAYVFN